MHIPNRQHTLREDSDIQIYVSDEREREKSMSET